MACGASCAVCAQRAVRRDVARKFDEFKVGFEGGVDEEPRLVRFARQLKREPRTTAYVIAYSPRIRNRLGSSHWLIAENRLLTTKAQLAHAYGVREGRIIGVDGGIREDATVELWILPPGVEPPKPRPEFRPEDVIECCVIRALGELYVYTKETPLTFRAGPAVQGCPKISYRWSVSSGKIVSGQGTDTITVDAKETSDRYVTATIDADGLSSECINRDTQTTIIGVAPYRLAEFEEKYSEDIKVWSDNLTLILQREPELRGHVIVYGGRNGGPLAAERADRARDYLVNSRGLETGRFSVVEGGYREQLTFEFWLVPRGAAPPPASPSVDEKYVRLRPVSRTPRRRR